MQREFDDHSSIFMGTKSRGNNGPENKEEVFTEKLCRKNK
jgi:hypothetical protein